MTLGLPVVGPDVKVWANDMRRFLSRQWDRLSYRTTGQTASDNGIMLWDAQKACPVVSLDGEWRQVFIASDPPASASATGISGQIAVDADYIYICTAADTWKRVAIATW